MAIAKLHPTLKKTEVEVMWIGCHLERGKTKVGGGNIVPEQGPQVVQLLFPLCHSLIDQANQLLEVVDACQGGESLASIGCTCSSHSWVHHQVDSTIWGEGVGEGLQPIQRVR